MNIETVVNCGVVLVGAVTMLSCLVKSKALKEAMPFLRKAAQPEVARHIRQHHALMVFFLIGYVLVIVAFVLRLPFVSEIFMSMIFLFAAIFVFLKVSIETKLLSGMQDAMRGLLPICAKCKKIRLPDADDDDQKSWKHIEEYIQDRSDIKFTHSYCPLCYQEAIIDMESELTMTDNQG